MSVKLIGDWSKLSKIANKFEDAIGKELGQNLLKIETKVLDHIDSQDLDWKELSPAYAKRKDTAKNPDILRAENTMYENVTTMRRSSLIGGVGTKRGVKTKDGKEVTDIAIFLEEGTSKMPARPLWKTVSEEMKDEVSQGVAGAAIKVFKDA